MKTTNKKSGSTLVMVMGVIVISSMISGAVMITSNNHYRLAGRQVDLELALNVAEAASEIAATYLAEQQGFVGTQYSDSGTFDGHAWSYVLDKIGWRTYTLSAVGTVRGVSRRVTIDRVYLPTYAKYALWMDTNGKIYFIPGETFDGHVHSNDWLWFSGSHSMGGPEFWEQVTSAQNYFRGNPEYATFHKGYELNASQGQMSTIDFDSGSVASLKNLADNFGTSFDRDVEIIFDGDDFLSRKSGSSSWKRHKIQEDQLVYVEGTTTLHGGEVDGRMTIVSENDIWIRDHITYADDPRNDSPSGKQSDDSLGLISKDDVWISTYAPDDLEIFAAILAAGVRNSGNRGSFGVSRYDDSRYGVRGDLTVYGSIVQDKRGAVGTFNSRGSSTGYSKDYYFDPRFEKEPPPYYPPVSEEVTFEGWEEDSA